MMRRYAVLAVVFALVASLAWAFTPAHDLGQLWATVTRTDPVTGRWVETGPINFEHSEPVADLEFPGYFLTTVEFKRSTVSVTPHTGQPYRLYFPEQHTAQFHSNALVPVRVDLWMVGGMYGGPR